MYKLICNSDPKKRGIENEDGSWDMTKFREHIQTCKKCMELVNAIGESVEDQLGLKPQRKKQSRKTK